MGCERGAAAGGCCVIFSTLCRHFWKRSSGFHTLESARVLQSRSLAGCSRIKNTVYIQSLLHVFRFFQQLSACWMSCYLLSLLPSTRCVEPQVILILLVSAICITDRKRIIPLLRVSELICYLVAWITHGNRGKGMSIGTYMYIWHNKRHLRVLAEEGSIRQCTF